MKPRLLKLARLALIAVERWKLRSDEAYMQRCADAGIAGTRSLAIWKRQCRARRRHIALLEART
jgi:hypothetical protein